MVIHGHPWRLDDFWGPTTKRKPPYIHQKAMLYIVYVVIFPSFSHNFCNHVPFLLPSFCHHFPLCFHHFTMIFPFLINWSTVPLWKIHIFWSFLRSTEAPAPLDPLAPPADRSEAPEAETLSKRRKARQGGDWNESELDMEYMDEPERYIFISYGTCIHAIVYGWIINMEHG